MAPVEIVRDGFDYLRDIITMIGYVATVGTFLYLFRRDNDKQKQIDALAKLAVISEEQLVLSVMPDLYKNGAMTNPKRQEITIDLLNRGENANLTEFRTNSEDIQLHNEHLPWVLEKGSERKIFARTIGKNANDCIYLITVVYEDKLQNIYEIQINGKGSNVNFGPAILKAKRKPVLAF